MKKHPKHITNENTIVKFLNGIFSESDREDFDSWINEDPEDRKTYEEVKKIWDHSENIMDFQSIDVNEDWSKVKKRVNFIGRKSIGAVSLKGSFIRFWRVAAVFIFLLGIGFLVKQYVFTSPDMVFVRTGEIKNDILLPDGSHVFLNKYSELKYPEKFESNIDKYLS